MSSDRPKDRLSKVLFDMAMHGMECAALVRPAQDGKTSGVCVIMEGCESIARIGGKLLQIARSLGDAGAENFGARPINEDIGLKQLFEIVDLSPNGWCWVAFKYGHMDLVLAIFVRETDIVAKTLTDNGVPCSLDAKKAAPGWELVEQ